MPTTSSWISARFETMARASMPSWPLTLNGRGVANMDEALREVFLLPIHRPFKELFNADIFRELWNARVAEPFGFLPEDLLNGIEQKLVNLLRALRQFSGGAEDEVKIAREVRQRLEAVLQLPVLESWYEWPADTELQAALAYLDTDWREDRFLWACLFGWVFVHALGRIVGEADSPQRSRSWLDEWLLTKIVAGALREFGLDDAAVSRGVRLIGLLTTNLRWFTPDGPAGLKAYHTLEVILKDGDGQQFLGINRYDDVLWFKGEALDELLWWLFLIAVIQTSADPKLPATAAAAAIAEPYKITRELLRAGRKAEYQVENLLELVKG